MVAPVLSCCDLFGNEGGDWQACIQEQLGLRYNMNLDPCFCGAIEDDYTLHDDSPCAGDWYGCGIIGATQTGTCGPGYCNLAAADSHSAGAHGEAALSVVPSPVGIGGWIGYSVPGIPGSSRVELAIHDTGGRLICRLVDRQLPVGQYSVFWDGSDHLGRPVPAGVYYCQLRSRGHRTVKPVLLVR